MSAKTWNPDVWETLIFICYYHVKYVFHSESTLYRCLNVEERLGRNRRDIWSLSDSNWNPIHNHLVRKWTLNHLAKLPTDVSSIIEIKPSSMNQFLLQTKWRVLNVKMQLQWKSKSSIRKVILLWGFTYEYLISISHVTGSITNNFLIFCDVIPRIRCNFLENIFKPVDLNGK